MSFDRFIGVNLGGGKGKNTAVAHLECGPGEAGGIRVVDFGMGPLPWYDDRLVAYLRAQPQHTAVAVDAPLTLPSSLRDDGSLVVANWFDARARAAPTSSGKPRYTPYTQRATEVILHEDLGLSPREALGQGMGPLTARAVHLARALTGRFVRDRDLIEVSPKATVARRFPGRLAREYKRTARSQNARLAILNNLEGLTFAPGQWREHALSNDHKFDAILCAYTAYLWSLGECMAPPDAEIASDGWIWVPKATEP